MGVLSTCRTCKASVALNAATCPRCGEKDPGGRFITTLLGICCLLGFIAYLAYPTEETQKRDEQIRAQYQRQVEHIAEAKESLNPEPVWVTRTGRKFIVCDSRQSAEKLKIAQDSSDMTPDWPRSVNVPGCRFAKRGEIVEMLGNDDQDSEIARISFPPSKTVQWTTVWMHGARTDDAQETPLKKGH